MSLRPFFSEEEEFFKHWFSHHPWELHAHDLATDIYQENGFVIVEMHVAGMGHEDINIEVIENNMLKISGSRESRTEKEKANFYKKEIKHGNFEQVFNLPCDVIADETTAEVKNGMLFVRMPMKKGDESSRKTIKIQPK